MKELAQKFVGKECLVYTVASDSSVAKGTIKEITGSGLLIDCDGNLQAVNLEFVTRIREWPRKKNGKKKEIILDQKVGVQFKRSDYLSIFTKKGRGRNLVLFYGAP